MKDAIAMIRKKNCTLCVQAMNGKCPKEQQLSMICPAQEFSKVINIVETERKFLFRVFKN
jgi:hypothetical protein